MAYPHGEEGPGHVGKLPQDVGSTRLVPSSTSRKGKKSDQVADKVDAMKEKKKIQRKDEYQRNKEKYKEYYQKNKDKMKDYNKKYLLKIKEKRKEVNCDVNFLLLTICLFLHYLRTFRMPILTRNGRKGEETTYELSGRR